MRVALVLLGLGVLAALAVWMVRPRAVAWSAIERDLATRYPDVPTTTTAALADRLGGPDAPVVLDARTEAEYAVSHLPGARRVDPDADARALSLALADVDRQRDVVVYCAVGVRSARVAQRLREVGFESVANLEGSIFRWANEGRAVVRDGQAVGEVHPYDAVWGRLLVPERRADLR